MDAIHESHLSRIEYLLDYLDDLDLDVKVEFINKLREIIHNKSPFKDEPVDLTLWKKSDNVISNKYNPNSVAPVEMRLLELSITSDGLTQPIVSWPKDDKYEVVDGFHRSRVCRECESVNKRIHGYMPITIINSDREDKPDRMASTIRHNRARGKHKVEDMSDIVLDLSRRNWSDEKIGTQLGMSPDEVLRLKQITGLAEMFVDQDFSMAWEADVINEDDNLIDED